MIEKGIGYWFLASTGIVYVLMSHMGAQTYIFKKKKILYKFNERIWNEKNEDKEKHSRKAHSKHSRMNILSPGLETKQGNLGRPKGVLAQSQELLGSGLLQSGHVPDFAWEAFLVSELWIRCLQSHQSSCTSWMSVFLFFCHLHSIFQNLFL